jgi:hypothetical protein
MFLAHTPYRLEWVSKFEESFDDLEASTHLVKSVWQARPWYAIESLSPLAGGAKLGPSSEAIEGQLILQAKVLRSKPLLYHRRFPSSISWLIVTTSSWNPGCSIGVKFDGVKDACEIG